ncbi:MAG: non-homologous end-joining DNA ligase [Candidatus Nanoarchaeia archaeon]
MKSYKKSLYEEKISPMLARLGDKSILKLKGFIFEPKLDGVRTILYKKGSQIKLLNRRGKWFEHRFPEIVAEAAKLPKDCILDGELVVLDEKGLPSFSRLQTRDQTEQKLKIDFLSRQLPATYYVFDVLAIGKKDYTSENLLTRKAKLEALLREFQGNKRIRTVFYTQNGSKLWAYVRKLKMEGVVAKKIVSKYELSKRSPFWIKIKNIKTTDCVICGYTSNRKPIASLILGQFKNNELIHVGEVGTGFSEAQLNQLYQMLNKIKTNKNYFPKLKLKNASWVKLYYVAEVKFLEYTKDFHLRAPSFMRLRFDKLPQECNVEA